jgi:hypothetical protein
MKVIRALLHPLRRVAMVANRRRRTLSGRDYTVTVTFCIAVDAQTSTQQAISDLGILLSSIEQ